MGNSIEVWPQWEIVEEIGKGAFGTVYKVKRTQMGNVSYAAVKVLRIPQNKNEARDLESSGMDSDSIYEYFSEMVKNLMSEIQIMESLKSANNIVAIEDYEVVQIDGRAAWDIYIRMELLTDLGTYLNKQEMTEKEIVKLGIDMTQALEVCEKSGIIHRDIKMDNIFVNRFGTFKLGDFGISKQLEKTNSAMSQKGTNMYMAPEVFKGEKYNNTVDIYSLGILLYRLLNSGRFPFMPPIGMPIHYDDSETAMQRRINGDSIPDIPGVQEQLMRIIRKMCSYSPNDRYAHATEVRTELEKYQNGNNPENSGNDNVEENDNKNTRIKYCIKCGAEIPTGESRCLICNPINYGDEKTSSAFSDDFFAFQNEDNSTREDFYNNNSADRRCPKCGDIIKYGENCPTCNRLNTETENTFKEQKKLCIACGNLIPQNSIICPVCKNDVSDNKVQTKQFVTAEPHNTESINENYILQKSTKDDNIASVMAFFLGDIGIHNFYLGRIKLGIATLIIEIIGFLIYIFGPYDINMTLAIILLGSMRGWALIDSFLIGKGYIKDGEGNVVCSRKEYAKLLDNHKQMKIWWKSPGAIAIMILLFLLGIIAVGTALDVSTSTYSNYSSDATENNDAGGNLGDTSSEEDLIDTDNGTNDDIFKTMDAISLPLGLVNLENCIKLSDYEGASNKINELADKYKDFFEKNGITYCYYYDGSVHSNAPDEGTALYYAVGDHAYYGGFSDGLFSGDGVAVSLNFDEEGDCKYLLIDGQFDNGYPNGACKYIDRVTLDGGTYEISGSYVNGYENGEMKATFSSDGESHEYSWEAAMGTRKLIRIEDDKYIFAENDDGTILYSESEDYLKGNGTFLKSN